MTREEKLAGMATRGNGVIILKYILRSSEPATTNSRFSDLVTTLSHYEVKRLKREGRVTVKQQRRKENKGRLVDGWHASKGQAWSACCTYVSAGKPK